MGNNSTLCFCLLCVSGYESTEFFDFEAGLRIDQSQPLNYFGQGGLISKRSVSCSHRNGKRANRSLLPRLREAPLRINSPSSTPRIEIIRFFIGKVGIAVAKV